MPIENGSRSPFKSSYAHNEVVTYRCNTGSGFTLQSGDLIRTCIGIDTWSGTAPACGGGMFICQNTPLIGVPKLFYMCIIDTFASYQCDVSGNIKIYAELLCSSRL